MRAVDQYSPNAPEAEDGLTSESMLYTLVHIIVGELYVHLHVYNNYERELLFNYI